MAPQTCPVCHLKINADETAYAFHVNAHFEGDDELQEDTLFDEQAYLWTEDDTGLSGSTSAGGRPGFEGGTLTCAFCTIDLEYFTFSEREGHLAEHMAEVEDEEREGAHSVGYSGRAQRDGRDKSWSPSVSSISSLPPNFSPGLIPVLHRMLLASPTTRSAILCYPRGTTHVSSVFRHDTLWGCGYRNFQMASSALSSLPCSPYARVLEKPAGGVARDGDSDGGEGRGVTMWDLQGWIEDAWAKGVDRIGKGQLSGKLRGTRKWIGTGDVWVGMTSRGIPCKLTDFPKTSNNEAQPTHILLQNWVVRYFSSDSSDQQDEPSKQNAMDRLMDSGGASVRISDKPPLILQHQGHSRCIVGFETTSHGDTNLLLFDPARKISPALRKLGIKAFEAEIQLAAAAPPVARPSTSTSNDDPSIDLSSVPSSSASASDSDEPPTGNPSSPDRKRKRHVLDPRRALGTTIKKTKGALKGKEDKDEYWRGDVQGALNPFRINLKTLKRNSEYQVLSFPGGPLMSLAERDLHKVVKSTIISR